MNEFETEREPYRDRGSPSVWVILFIMFAGLTWMSIDSILNPPGLSDDQEWLYRFNLKYEQKYESAEGEAAEKSVLIEARKELETGPLKTKGAKGSRERYLYIIANELGEQVAAPKFSTEVDDVSDKQDKEKGKATRSRLNEALTQLYNGSTKSSEQLRALRTKINANSTGHWPFSLAIKKAEPDKKAATPTGQIVAGSIMLCGLIAGTALIFVYLARVASGTLKRVGFPLAGASASCADELGLKVIAYLVVFAVMGGFLASFLNRYLSESWSDVAGSILILLVLIQVARAKWISSFPGLSGLGFRTEALGRQILHGLVGFVMAIPVVLAVSWISTALLPDLPSADHPVSKELLDSARILPAIIGAVFFAPITEELFFRACLFQGLAIRTHRPVFALLVSSVVFASIHPQGAASWLPLGAVGAMGALTFWQTGSVISAMVLHGLWNLSIIALALATQ